MTYRALAIAIASELVERDADGVPIAFRIWTAGVNASDDGDVLFSAKSAKALLAEQDARGRDYSIDVDHLSLSPVAPPASRGAVGWHRLAVREGASGEPELWAVDVRWSALARDGLTSDPPTWKYFSPAFRTGKGGEVTSYINLALCINPLTHQLPALAARVATATDEGDPIMKRAALLAALASLAASAGEDPEKQKAAADLKAFLEDQKDDDGGEPEEKKADDAPPPPEKDEEKKADSCDEKQEQKAVDAAAVRMASELTDAKTRLSKLEIREMLAARPDVPDSVRAWCMTQSSATVRSFLAAQPKPSAPREDKASQTDPDTREGLQGRELEDFERSFGLRKHAAAKPTRHADGSFSVPYGFSTAQSAGKGE